MKALEYTEYRKFLPVINKAIISCENINHNKNNHFVDVNKMVNIGSNTSRTIKDYKLSRYACYLIAQNADSRKKVVAFAQTYFAYQTRKQELLEQNYNMLTEEDKRIFNRKLTKKGNYELNQTALKAGVRNFGKFRNVGYKGLYNGETADDIAKRKNLHYREEILDHMGSEELADNLFRIVQTESKIRNEKIIGEDNCSKTHYDMGHNIREFIKNNGGTMPENLPTPKHSLKEIENKKES